MQLSWSGFLPWVVWVKWVVICVGVDFGLVGGGGLVSIGVILVGNDVVNGCSDVGLVVQRLGQ